MFYKLISDRISHQISWIDKKERKNGLRYGELSGVSLEGNTITLNVSDVKLSQGSWVHLDDCTFVIEDVLPEDFLNSRGELKFRSINGKVSLTLHPYRHSEQLWR